MGEDDLEWLWAEAEEATVESGLCAPVRPFKMVACGWDAFEDEKCAVEKTASGHICPGPCLCPYIVLNDDRFLVCAESGIVYNVEQVDEGFDNQLSRRSSNPDDASGDVVYGGFRGRRDGVAASEQAILTAITIDETVQAQWVPIDDGRRREPVKRGARCVGDTEPTNARKRARTPKKEVNDRAGTQLLVEDAALVISRLLHCDGKRDSVVSDSANTKLAQVDPAQLVDSLHRRYVRECLSTNKRPNMHVVADIVVGAREIVREARAKLRYERAHSANNVPIVLRERMANLSVALWLASCQTPYVKQVSKTDGFRPFVAGVLYGTRRGFSLGDGTELVPCVPSLAAVLPNLRMAASSSVKTLQASSHRGLCLLQKAVNSLDGQEDCKRVYGDAIRAAKAAKNEARGA